MRFVDANRNVTHTPKTICCAASEKRCFSAVQAVEMQFSPSTGAITLKMNRSRLEWLSCSVQS